MCRYYLCLIPNDLFLNNDLGKAFDLLNYGKISE